MTKATIVCFLFLMATTCAVAQDLLMGPSTSEYDSSSLFANPALTTFQVQQVGMGAKSYYQGLGGSSGLSDIRQGWFVYSRPNLLRYVVGMGLGVQYFDSPGYQRIRAGGMVAFRFLRFVSVGVNAGMISISYDDSKFDLVDANDPVFASGLSKTALAVSVGIYIRPVHNFSLSAGIRNANNPNTSLIGAAVPSTSTPYGGVSLAFRSYRLNAEVVSTLNGVEPNVSFEFGSTDGSFLRVGANPGAEWWAAEAQFRFGGRFLASYRFSMPYSGLSEVTSGSHQVGLTVEFGKNKPPKFIQPVSELFGISVKPIVPQWEPRVHVSATEDILTVYEKILERRVASDVPESALSVLTVDDLGRLDSTFFFFEQEMSKNELAAIDSDSLNLESPFSHEYERALEEVSRELVSDSTGGLSIVVTLPALGKAAAVRNLIAKDSSVPKQTVKIFKFNPTDSLTVAGLTSEDIRTDSFRTQSYVEFEPDSTSIEVIPIHIDPSSVRSWKLEVTDLEGNVIASEAKTGPLPEGADWNWRTESGDLVDAGTYFYHIEWTDDTGQKFRSRTRRLLVVKHVRRIVFDVSTRPPSNVEGLKKRELIIRNK